MEQCIHNEQVDQALSGDIGSGEHKLNSGTRDCFVV